jgi:AraC family transcriptional regulator
LANRHSGGAIDIEVSKRKSWPGVAVEYVRVSAPSAFNFKAGRSSNHIVLYDLYRTDGDTAASDLPRNFAKDLRNKMTYAPAGCELEGWCKIEKCGGIETVAIEPEDGNETPADLMQLPPRLEFEDRMLRWVMLRFRALLDDPSLDTPGYAETLAEVLAFDLRRVAGRLREAPLQSAGLSASQIETVTEYIDSHLAEKTSVAELASLLDLTRFHFIRSFKRTTGVPPHQFMIRRRVDRAMEMLTGQNHSIADVAARTGFGSPIQLTRAFRRVVGTTPSDFRRSAR